MTQSLWRLTFIFLRIANLTFGGGNPTMAALQRELVARRGWLTPERFALAYTLARITPGTNMLAFSAAVAWYLKGWPGAVLAVVAASVPSAVLIVWLTRAYETFKDNTLAAGAIAGMLAAAAGMMLAAAWQLSRPHVRRETWKRTVAFVAGSAGLLLGLGVAPIQVLGLAALAGYFWRD